MITLGDNPRERIAIIGSGISGLVCAHHLHREYDVTLYEANDYVGGHTNTVDVMLGGRTWSVDTGFIVFNELNYPNFVRLLDDLDVPSHPSTMSFSVRCDRTGVEYNGTSVNGLFAQRSNLIRPRFLRMVADILRFNREAIAVLDGDDASLTVERYVQTQRYGREFAEHYLLPMGASIWSCPSRAFLSFPIRFVVEFLRNHVMLSVGGRPQWRVVTGGSQRYVERITRAFRDRIKLETPVHAVRRLPDRVDLITGRDQVESYDRVVFACHSDQALEILSDPSPLEVDVLGAIPYQANEAVLHTDTSVLPRRRRAWAAWNHHVRDGDDGRVAITYDMNVLQGLDAPETFCVTLNDDGRIDPRKVIDRYDYAHPVCTVAGAAARRRHGELLDVNRTSFCGAYWGFGFHEDGVKSALAVCEALQTAVPA